jgi:hypothetical protein
MGAFPCSPALQRLSGCDKREPWRSFTFTLAHLSATTVGYVVKKA